MDRAGWLQSDVLSEDEARHAQAHALGVPFVVLEREDISPDALALIPEPLSRTHNMVAYRVQDGVLEVAMLSLDDIEHLHPLGSAWRVKPRLTNRDSIKRALLLYQKILKEKFAGMIEKGADAADSLLKHALASNASHIHLEPKAAGTLVRYRIEGALHEAMRLPAEVGAAIVERLKSLAKLFPVATAAQEGRFKFAHEGDTVAVGINTLPTARGEKLTLRLAKEKNGQKGFTLESLGFHGRSLQRMHELLEGKAVTIVVAGESGSGKTTLLYTLLDLLNSPHRAISTIEDHVAYALPHISQTQARPEIGLQVAAGLRAILKHDPDVVMLDEADADCVPLMQSAQRRRIFLLAAAEDPAPFAGAEVITLRLLKKLCPNCKVAFQPSRSELEELGEKASFGKILAALKEEDIVGQETQWKDLAFYRAVGCNMCDGGYKGMVGIQEVSDTEGGGLTLLEDAIFKAAQGLTTLEEIAVMASK